MITETQSLGPVSQTLEADLRTFVLGKGIVIWLDEAEQYTHFVDQLIALRGQDRRETKLPYEIKAFRGSYLELLLALEPLAAGVDKSHLVIHLPGIDKAGVLASPVLELYAAGETYNKKLAPLITAAAAGRVLPDQITAYLKGPSTTLEAADAWLTAAIEGSQNHFTIGLRGQRPSAVIDDLLTATSPLRQHLAIADDLAALWQQIEAWTGLPGSFRHEAAPTARANSEQPQGRDIAFTTASWALCVEYVDDLKRPPLDPFLTVASGLPDPIIENCRGLARHLRRNHPGFYEQTADETETRLVEETANAEAKDLGQIDTFRFEEDIVRRAALEELRQKRWENALDWAALRLDGESFWFRGDVHHRSAWELVRAAATLGRAIQAAGSSFIKPEATAGGFAITTVDQATQHYTRHGAAVDQAHRHLEQHRVKLLYPPLPELETLRDRLNDLRHQWRTWADVWARDFNHLCRKHGFLPEPALQQRNLFEEVVMPAAQKDAQKDGITAFFIVDGLRYEMGQELYHSLAGSTRGDGSTCGDGGTRGDASHNEMNPTTVQLKPRLAELPTITNVGMNVLAPVAERGRLRVDMKGGKLLGFSTGQFRVHDPKTRKRAMHNRVGGDTCPWLSLQEVISRDATSLKRSIAQARLVVVHSREADDAGEKGLGVALFEHVLNQLRGAWRRLRAAGVSRFVITADHGFLQLDETARDIPYVLAHGRKIDPKRRHVISSDNADRKGKVHVELTALGYEGGEGHLILPETTAVFDTGRKPMDFVHGGNSLQERVIPVITLSHRAPAGKIDRRYVTRAEVRQGTAGLHVISVRVDVADQGSLAFAGRDKIELDLRAPDHPDVRVEIREVQKPAFLSGGLVAAPVGQRFDLLFRLLGTTDARVVVELMHPTAEVDVEPFRIDHHFAVAARRSVPSPSSDPPTPSQHAWLDAMPTPEIRQFFEHLAAHGAVTEGEAIGLLGGPRKQRSFARKFEEHAAKAPFAVRIDTVAGVKRYVRY